MIIGKAEATEWMLVAPLVEGHVLLEDAPGIGKTTLAKALGAEPRLLLRPDPIHAGPVAQRRDRVEHFTTRSVKISSSALAPC